jgi:signal transduction histidine kinase
MKPLAGALEGLLGKLRQKIEAEQTFVASAAHEMRTPLAVVTAQAHVLAKATTDEQRSDAEHQLEAGMSRASHLIDQLLVLAGVDMDHPSARTTVDLAQLARQEIAHFVPAATARDIDISLDTPDRLAVMLEPQLFRSVLQNLVDNAIRYGREGGRVTIQLVRRDGAVVLSVTDDGPGIAESDRSRIFDRFYRGEKPPDAQGTGLGLAIVKQAAARMDGKLQLTGGFDGRGCCFSLEIPVGSTVQT